MLSEASFLRLILLFLFSFPLLSVNLCECFSGVFLCFSWPLAQHTNWEVEGSVEELHCTTRFSMRGKKMGGETRSAVPMLLLSQNHMNIKLLFKLIYFSCFFYDYVLFLCAASCREFNDVNRKWMNKFTNFIDFGLFLLFSNDFLTHSRFDAIRASECEWNGDFFSFENINYHKKCVKMSNERFLTQIMSIWTMTNFKYEKRQWKMLLIVDSSRMSWGFFRFLSSHRHFHTVHSLENWNEFRTSVHLVVVVCRSIWE